MRHKRLIGFWLGGVLLFFGVAALIHYRSNVGEPHRKPEDGQFTNESREGPVQETSATADFPTQRAQPIVPKSNALPPRRGTSRDNSRDHKTDGIIGALRRRFFGSGRRDSWEDKPKGEYTLEERLAAGLTNEKLYASMQATNWAAVAHQIAQSEHPELLQEVTAMSDELNVLTAPYREVDIRSILERERHLYQLVRSRYDTTNWDTRARNRFDRIARGIKMWETGEANNLVERKIKAEDQEDESPKFRSRLDDNDDDQEEALLDVKPQDRPETQAD